MTNVFVNADGTNFPEEPVAYTVQADRTDITSNPVNPGPANKVFGDAGTGVIGHTPANTPGWTVQQVNSGKSS
jgi:hypothetical protein